MWLQDCLLMWSMKKLRQKCFVKVHSSKLEDLIYVSQVNFQMNQCLSSRFDYKIKVGITDVYYFDSDKGWRLDTCEIFSEDFSRLKSCQQWFDWWFFLLNSFIIVFLYEKLIIMDFRYEKITEFKSKLFFY
mgnify:FL=1